jgi:hypothetical protein
VVAVFSRGRRPRLQHAIVTLLWTAQWVGCVADRAARGQEAVFARLLNVPVVTEASWEVGRRNPSGAALRLLQIAKKEPEVLLTAAEA